MTQIILRWLLAVLYFLIGVVHLAQPIVFLEIIPEWVPAPELVITLTGVAEILGAIALIQPVSPGLRKLAGYGLAAYALCVWPANINHMIMDMALPDGGDGLGYHIPRMIMQPLMIWAARWTSAAINWPWRSSGASGTAAQRSGA